MGEFAHRDPLRVMPDGTVKQVNLLTGVEVWTVPGRADRPISEPPASPVSLGHGEADRWCAFCPDRMADTTPEKARRVCTPNGWQTLYGVLPSQWHDTQAQFRRIPNLFAIVNYSFWTRNYGYHPPQSVLARCAQYCADPQGRKHVESLLKIRKTASSPAEVDPARLSDAELAQRAIGMFASGHDVIVARRHFVDGATDSSQLAASGTLTPKEHSEYIGFTVRAMQELYEQNHHVRYVAVFQNWLRQAGASFDHLHKQLVSIDERSQETEQELVRLRANPNAYNDLALNVAIQQNLVIAENSHAIAYAGFGHRFPTVEIVSKSPVCEPWLQNAAEQEAMSALVHACHAATGIGVPCNEEWHHRAPDVDLPMPWRINLKWRVSTLAGFEGGTKIYLNTLDPWHVRDRLVPRLHALRDAGRLATGLSIGEECPARYNSLRYNPVLQH